MRSTPSRWMVLAGLGLLSTGCTPRLQTDNHFAFEQPIALQMSKAMPISLERPATQPAEAPLPVSVEKLGGITVDKPIQILVDKPIEISVRVATGVPYKGVYISDQMMELIRVNTTTADYVLAVFGPPTDRTTLNDGDQIWRWTYQPLEETSPLMTVTKQTRGETAPTTHVTAFVRIRKNVVVEKFKG